MLYFAVEAEICGQAFVLQSHVGDDALIPLLRVQHFAHSAAKDYAKVLLFLRICKRIVILIVFCGVGEGIGGGMADGVKAAAYNAD